MQSQYHALHYSASSSKKELNTDYSSSYFNNLQHYNIYLTHHSKVNIVCRQLIDYAEAKKAHCPVVNNITDYMVRHYLHDKPSLQYSEFSNCYG